MSNANKYRVKHYGSDRWANSPQELRAVLRKHYRNTSVTLCLPQPSGVDRLVFVDVDASGEVWSSYGTRKAFDWSWLERHTPLNDPREMGYLAQGKYPVQVLRSAAGYYIGTQDEQGMPYSRESVEYYPTEEQAGQALSHHTWTQRPNP